MKPAVMALIFLLCSCTYSGITNKNQRGGSGGSVRVIYRTTPSNSDYEKALLDTLHNESTPKLENDSQ